MVTSGLLYQQTRNLNAHRRRDARVESRKLSPKYRDITRLVDFCQTYRSSRVSTVAHLTRFANDFLSFFDLHRARNQHKQTVLSHLSPILLVPPFPGRPRPVRVSEGHVLSAVRWVNFVQNSPTDLRDTRFFCSCSTCPRRDDRTGIASTTNAGKTHKLSEHHFPLASGFLGSGVDQDPKDRSRIEDRMFNAIA